MPSKPLPTKRRRRPKPPEQRWQRSTALPHWIAATTTLLQTYFPASWEQQLYKTKLAITHDMARKPKEPKS